MNDLPFARRSLTALTFAAMLLAGCSDTAGPTPAAQPPAASASDTSAQTSLVGTMPAGPSSEVPANVSAAQSDLTKAQQSNAMPMPGQANDHSTPAVKATQKSSPPP